MLSEQFNSMPGLIEMFDQLSEFAQPSSTDIFKVNCLLSNCLDRIVVKPIYDFLKIRQLGKDLKDSISIKADVFQVFNGI